MREIAVVTLDGSAESAREARRLVRSVDGELADLRADATLVLSELTTNACLHGRPPITVRLLQGGGSLRVEVTDTGGTLPVRPRQNVDAMTGRGLALIDALAQSWGVEPLPAGGKTVWATVGAAPEPAGPPGQDVDAQFARLAEAESSADAEPLYTVQLGAVPTELLLASKSHIDDVVRELELVQSQDGSADEQLPGSVQRLIDVVTKDFAGARDDIKRQALESAGRGETVTELHLRLPLSAAADGERYLSALEEIDRQSRSARMLTLAPRRSHVVFRRWYLRGVIDQLRAAARGEPVAPPAPFPQVLAAHLDELAALLETQVRLRILQSVTGRLAEASSVAEMARIVVDSAAGYDGVESARVFVLTEHATIASLAWRGGPPGADPEAEVPLDADVPAALVARTGVPLHVRTISDAYSRFPRFASEASYPGERSLHVVPLTVAGTVLGLLALTFRAGEVTDETQEDFVTSIASALAQAIQRSRATERADAERHRELALLAAQAEALTAVVAGRPLVTVLDGLLLAIETASQPGTLASVLLLDPDPETGRPRLRHGSGPSLPAEYNAAIDGVEIGPSVGSCGTAAYRRERVIVEDVRTDPLWAEFRELAEQHGLRACWSTPVMSAAGELLGTFAIYQRQPHRPSVADTAFIDVLVGTVALIIGHSRDRTRHGGPLLQDEAAARLALELAVSAGGVGTFDWNLVTGELSWDEQLLDIFGLPQRDRRRTTQDFFDVVHPGDRDRVRMLLERAIADAGDYEAEYRIGLPDGSTRWMLARGRVLADRDGRAVRLVGAAQDTTARRETDAGIARVMDSLSTAFYFVDTEWRFTFLNTEAERLLGRSREELLDRTIWGEFPAAIGSDFETHYRHAATTGEPVAFDAYYPQPLHAWYEVRAWPNPGGLAVYFIDVTERRRAEAAAQRSIGRAGLLAQVSEELSGTLDPATAMHSLAQILTPSLADWCVITLIDDNRSAGTARGLGQTVGWHPDPALRDLVGHYARTRLPEMTDRAIVLRAVETADAQIINGNAMASLHEMFAPDAEPLRILGELDTDAVAVLPLLGQERPVGMLSLFNTAARGRFSDEDLELFRDLAARAGLVLDRARLYRQQRAVAETLQRSLLHPPQTGEPLRIAVAYVPAAEVAQVGGDWYDAFEQPDGSTTLIIGDVMGHDLSAAAAMGETRMLIRTLAAQQDGAPAPTLEAAERVMRQLRSDVLATVLVGRLQAAPDAAGAARVRFTFSNAGHPPPLVLRPDGVVDVLEQEAVDTLLGVGPAARGEQTAELPAGAMLVLYTDGLVERRDSPIGDGIERLRSTLAGLHGATPDEVRDAVLARMLPDRVDDDVALLVVSADVVPAVVPQPGSPESVLPAG